MDPNMEKRNHSYIYPHNNFDMMIGNGGKIAFK